MALFRGHLGAIMVPTTTINFSAIAITDGGSSGTFSVTSTPTRVFRAFTEAAVVTDFVIAATVGGTDFPDSLNRAAGELVWNAAGFTGPYTATSSNSRVYALGMAGGFFEWNLTSNNDNAEVTQFQDTFAEFVNLTKRWTGEAAAYWLDEGLTLNAGSNLVDVDDGPFVVRFLDEYNTSDSEFSYWSGLAHIPNFTVTQTIGAVVMKRISFLGQADLYHTSC